MAEENSIRLNKYISDSGICSRREADKYILNGNVVINGRKAKIGDRVHYNDKVIVNGQYIQPRKAENHIYLAFNKPTGIVSTTEEGVRDNIIDYVNYPARIFPIGRLDKDSQGLIFLTNNGDIVNKILRASNHHEKEYLVTVNKPITDDFITAMGSGVPILGATTKKCIVKKESPFIFRIILVQGMNRQIRRMCEYFKYDVVKLERIRIMNVHLKGLPLGDWRELTKDELTGIFKLIEKSGSTDILKSQTNTNPKSNKKPHKRRNVDSKKSNNSHKKLRKSNTSWKLNGKRKKTR